MTSKDYIDAQNLSLDDWLDLLFNAPRDKIFLRTAFPTETHKEEYISTINQRSEKDVCKLIYYFLIHSGVIPFWDQLKVEILAHTYKQQQSEIQQEILESQYVQRLLTHHFINENVLPWEGITWILDLLPNYPKDALSVIEGYIKAHVQWLHDRHIDRLFDAMEIIRAKFIGLPNTYSERISALRILSSRDFEHIVERLYHTMGYQTHLTSATKDQGRDIVARKDILSQKEIVLVECKLYETPVGVELTRALLGVLSSEKVNKGVIVTTSRFTKGAINFASENPRLELIDGGNLINLLNEHLGYRWPLRIERLLADSKDIKHQLENKH